MAAAFMLEEDPHLGDLWVLPDMLPWHSFGGFFIAGVSLIEILEAFVAIYPLIVTVFGSCRALANVGV